MELLAVAFVDQTLAVVAGTYQAVGLLSAGMMPACAGSSTGTAGLGHASHCRDYPIPALGVHLHDPELLLHGAGLLDELEGFLPTDWADEDLSVDSAVPHE